MFLTSRFAFSITPPATKVENRTSSTYGIKSDVFDSAEEVHIFSYVGIIGWNENVLTYDGWLVNLKLKILDLEASTASHSGYKIGVPCLS